MHKLKHDKHLKLRTCRAHLTTVAHLLVGPISHLRLGVLLECCWTRKVVRNLQIYIPKMFWLHHSNLCLIHKVAIM